LEGFIMPARKPEECDLLLIDAIHKGDLDGAVALYEPKATFVLDSGEVITGQAAIRQVAQGYMAMKPKFTQEVKALLSGDGDLALTSSTWSVSGVDADGKAFTADGKSMEVVRRQPDGTWRFVIDNPHGGE
jgi:ketosteroid isomerase-like protein